MTVTWEETQRHPPLFRSVTASAASQTSAALRSSGRELLTALLDRPDRHTYARHPGAWREAMETQLTGKGGRTAEDADFNGLLELFWCSLGGFWFYGCFL